MAGERVRGHLHLLEAGGAQQWPRACAVASDGRGARPRPAAPAPVRAGSSEWIERGVPVDVPDDHPAAGPKRPVELPQRGLRLRNVLQHLHRERGVEARVRHGQGDRLAFEQLDVVVPGAAARRQRQHGLAAVHAADRPVLTDLGQQLDAVEARPAAHVQDALARRRRAGPPARSRGGGARRRSGRSPRCRWRPDRRIRAGPFPSILTAQRPGAVKSRISSAASSGTSS